MINKQLAPTTAPGAQWGNGLFLEEWEYENDQAMDESGIGGLSAGNVACASFDGRSGSGNWLSGGWRGKRFHQRGRGRDNYFSQPVCERGGGG